MNISRTFQYIIAFICYTLALSPCTNAQVIGQQQPPKSETRAVWLTTIGGLDWPDIYAQTTEKAAIQRKQLTDILDRLKSANINTVLMQTRVRGTTAYPSAYEPWDGSFSGNPGVSPGYDVLQFAIDECHKRGMEIHAWVVTIPLGKTKKIGAQRLMKKMKRNIITIGDEAFMNPETQETADYLANICQEITDNYDVDGIHLDYIRYPETWRKKTNPTLARSYITKIVRKIHSKVKASKPWVKMSCSPVGKHDDLARYSSKGWNAYSRVYQDAQAWMQQGLMDQIYPMMYFDGDNFYPFALDWQENACGADVVPGLGIYFLSPKEKNWKLDAVERQMRVARDKGMGHCFFRSRFFTDNTKGLYQLVAEDIDAYPALVPPMRQATLLASPPPPLFLNLERYGDFDNLSWPNNGEVNGSYARYNIYRSNHWPVDITDPRNMIATYSTQCLITIPHAKGARYHYAVTTIDRYGQESTAAMTEAPESTVAYSNEDFINHDGKLLPLPAKHKCLDAPYIIAQSQEGVSVASWKYTSGCVDISHLQPGIYTLRSINKKGVTHKVGVFAISPFKKP